MARSRVRRSWACCARTSSPSTRSACSTPSSWATRPLWEALQERDALYAKPHDQLTDEDGMRLGELEGIVGEEGGYTAESDAAILLRRPGHPRIAARAQDGRAARRTKSPRAAGAGAVRQAARRCCWTSPPTTWISIPFTGCRIILLPVRRLLIVISHDRHFLNSVCTHIADIDYQTIIIYTGGYDDMVLAKTQIRSRMESENAQREKKIEQLNEFIARFSAGTRSSPGHLAQEGSGAAANRGPGEVQHPAAVHPLRDEPPIGPASAGIQGGCASPTTVTESFDKFTASDRARRKDRADRPQRRRQDHYAEVPAPQRARDFSMRADRSFPSMPAR